MVREDTGTEGVVTEIGPMAAPPPAGVNVTLYSVAPSTSVKATALLTAVKGEGIVKVEGLSVSFVTTRLMTKIGFVLIVDFKNPMSIKTGPSAAELRSNEPEK